MENDSSSNNKNVEEKEHVITWINKKPMTNIQGSICLTLLFLIFTVYIYNNFLPKKYEYRSVTYYSEGKDRLDSEAMSFASVEPNIDELNILGNEGWEIINSYLEMETAFPNFGNPNYLTGLQPNVRPQRVVYLLKRQKIFLQYFKYNE